MTTTTTKTEEVPLPVCRKCQRQAGLSGGICAYCMRPSLSSRTTDGEMVELDRALTELHRQAVRDGWVGQKPDMRPCPNEAKLKR
jgi:hypothetical protein